MVITVTSIKLRHVWQFFCLSWYGLKITIQARKQKGHIRMKNTGFGYLHYTASAWEAEEDMKNFARSGAHLKAMKQSRNLSSEIRTYTYSGEQLPDWKTVRQLLKEKGKSISFE